MIRYLLPLFLILSGCDDVWEATHDSVCPYRQSLQASNGKPTIAVFGDSISIGYTPTLQAKLTTNDVVHNPCNAMNTEWTKLNIDTWLDSRPYFEAIVFNNGLWDISEWDTVYPFQYAQNLAIIAEKIKHKTKHPIFVLSTMVPKGAEGRENSDIVVLNNIAVKVMAYEGIPVVDLYTLSLTLPHPTPTDPHYTASGYKTLGRKVLQGLSHYYKIR